eukprot:257105-Karenia_brevis.AAC.1
MHNAKALNKALTSVQKEEMNLVGYSLSINTLHDALADGDRKAGVAMVKEEVDQYKVSWDTTHQTPIPSLEKAMLESKHCLKNAFL